MKKDVEKANRLLVALAKGDEQCETAWTHITSCPRCMSIMAISGISYATGERAHEGKPPDPQALHDIKTLVIGLTGSAAAAVEVLSSIYEEGDDGSRE